MIYAACALGGAIVGFVAAIWGFMSIPRNAARMFNTPPKDGS